MVVFSSVRLGVSPKVNALATLIILVVTTFVFLTWWYARWVERRDRQLLSNDKISE